MDNQTNEQVENATLTIPTEQPDVSPEPEQAAAEPDTVMEASSPSEPDVPVAASPTPAAEIIFSWWVGLMTSPDLPPPHMQSPLDFLKPRMPALAEELVERLKGV
jgi:hypothetical protein